MENRQQWQLVCFLLSLFWWRPMACCSEVSTWAGHHRTPLRWLGMAGYGQSSLCRWDWGWSDHARYHWAWPGMAVQRRVSPSVALLLLCLAGYCQPFPMHCQVWLAIARPSISMHAHILKGSPIVLASLWFSCKLEVHKCIDVDVPNITQQ